MLTIVATLQDARAIALDEDRGCAWITQADGSVVSVDLSTGTTTPEQTLVPPAVGIAVGGSTGVLTDTDGTVAGFDPDNPTTAGAAIATVFGRPGQVALTAKRGSALVVTGRTRAGATHPTRRAALAVVDLGDGSVKRVNVDGITGVAVAGRTIYVAGTETGSGGQGYVGILRGWATQPLASGLPRAGQLGTAEAGDLLLVAHPAIGAISAVRPATAAVDTVSTSAVPGRLVVAQGLADSRIAVLTADALAIVDALTDLSVDPWIEPLGHALFVASWSPLSYSLGNTGLTPADVQFAIPDGPDAGIISAATLDGTGDPVPLLIAGGLVGSHELDLVETATSTLLASTKFEVTDHWDDEDTGPSGTYVGASSFDGASGWGGGPGTPQNIAVHPHVGDWRALVLMVDTTTARWPTDNPTMTANRTAILGHVSTGVNFNGVNRSARQYYEENSRYAPSSGGNPARGLTLTTRNNQTFGPVNLPGSWTDYFAQTKDKNGVVTDNRWSSKGGTVQTIISRAISDNVCTTADFTATDVLIIIPCSPDATGGPPARFVWPHAHDPVTFLAGTNPTTDMRNLAYAFGPLDFNVHDGRQLHSTLSHELGHTLGLPDLYDFPVYGPDISGRLTGGWDMMAGSRDTLPHYTLSNKMRMNWVPAGELKLFNFQGSGAVDTPVTLHASELDTTGSQFRGIEIRLADGWNYYVEYRAEQPGLASDDLITDRTVVVTDVTSDAFVAPVARPNIVFVRNDIDGDGPLLNVNADLEEKDPGTQMDLVLDVVSTAVDNAVVRVRYGANGKPEPGIRPWDGGPTWQSPDIEIRNDRATADPGKWFNVPWLGHDNTVVAKVRNSGDLLAKGVVVDFFITEYSSGDGPWIPLGNVSHDIAANTTQEFAVGWAPDAADGKHYCIIVRIRLYQDPGNLAIVDNNIYNNEARSNYTKFISASSSPSSRVGTDVLLANPFDDSTHVYAVVKQTHPQHRVFIEHQWLRVDGHGQRPIKVWDEALYGTPEWDVVQREGHQEGPSFLWEVPNQVSVAGWATRPFETDCGAKTLTGGVGLRVDAGRATRVEILERSYNYVMGFVEFVDDKTPVTNGLVLIEVSVAPGKYFTVTTDVHADGRFGTDFNNEFGEETATVEAHFLGTYSAAPSTSGPVPIR